MRARLQGAARHLIGLPSLHQHNDPLRAGCLVRHSKHRYAALMHAGQVCDGFLDFLRIEMPAGTYDDVLDTAGDKNVASSHVAAVAGIEPLAVEQLAGLGLTAK